VPALPRVLKVTFWYPPAVGGVSQQADLLARTLARLGVPVSVATIQVPGLKPTEECQGVRIHRLPTLPGGYRTRLYPWLFSLEAFLLWHWRDYDVLHIHQALYPAAVSVAVAKLCGQKTVVKVAGSGASGNMMTLRTRWLGWLARALIARADCWISLSDEMTAELLENRFDPHRIAVMSNGVEVGHFRDASPKAGLPSGRLVVAVGRLSHEKGFDVLVQAWPGVVSRAPDARLLILGDGPERGALEAMAQQLNIAEVVTFVGDRLDVPNYLAAAATYVLPSRHEGMSNALLEAMASGRACLASDIPPNAKVIQPGVNGLLFKTQSPGDLADKLVLMLKDEALRKQLGARALQTVLERFSIEAVAQRYIELYRAMVEKRSLSQNLR